MEGNTKLSRAKSSWEASTPPSHSLTRARSLLGSGIFNYSISLSSCLLAHPILSHSFAEISVFAELFWNYSIPVARRRGDAFSFRNICGEF